MVRGINPDIYGGFILKIVLATGNTNKLRELRQMLQDTDISIAGLDEFPDYPEVVEDGKSFAENALKKARAAAQHCHMVAVADDSGLEVDILEGRPGIYSARYAGDDADDKKNNEKLLEELSGVPEEKRTARFCCVIAVVDMTGNETTVEGTYKGLILNSPRGGLGFGYDPLFLDPVSGLTFAEMEPDRKNRISHRASAMQGLKKILSVMLKDTGCPDCNTH